MKTFRDIVSFLTCIVGVFFLTFISQDTTYHQDDSYLFGVFLLVIVPLVAGYFIATKKYIYLGYVLCFYTVILVFAKPSFWNPILNNLPRVLLALAIVFVIVIAISLILHYNSFVGQYNSLSKKDEKIKQMFGDLEVLYQFRIDKISALGSWTDKYLSHEKNIFYDTAKLRSSYQEATNTDQKIKIINNLENQFGKFLINIESYPDLKANQAIKTIMTEISSTEKSVMEGVNKYNQEVSEYNQEIRSFPIVIFSQYLGLKPQEYFKNEVKA